MYTEKVIQSFWAKVAICAHGRTCEDCCWEWQAGKARAYGTFGIYHGKDETGRFRYQSKRANRVCWEISHGVIPTGLWVLHNCPHGDNPACVNPAHLWLGTPDDNQKDSMRKGRRPRGEKHGLRLHPEAVTRGERSGSARLTDTEVYAIRTYGRLGYPQTQIAQAFHISSGNVGAILRRKSWAHLPEKEDEHFVNTLGSIQDLQPRGEAMPWAKLTEEDVREIRNLAAQGWYQYHIAQRYGVSKSLVGLVVHRKIWKHI